MNSRVLLAACFALPTLAARAQTLFSQNFNSSSTLSNYVGTGAGQFDAITVGGTGTATISDGALDLTKNSSNSATFARTTNLTSASALIYQFDFSIAGNTTAQTSSNAPSNTGSVSFYIGSGLTTSTTGEAAGAITARFNLGWTTTDGQWNLINPAGSVSGNQSGSQTITWYVNNSAASFSYTGPDSGTHTIAAGAYDLWIGSTRSFAGTSVTTTGLDATDFKFRWGNAASNATLSFDNFSVSAVPEPSTYAALLGAAALAGTAWYRRSRRHPGA